MCLVQVSDTPLMRNPTDFSSAVLAQDEGQYASSVRQPLGTGYNRGHELPQATKDEQFRFGLTSVSSE